MQDEATTAQINRALGTSYSIEDIDDAPQLWIDKMMLWINRPKENNPHDPS